jgi:hypothetical protein
METLRKAVIAVAVAVGVALVAAYEDGPTPQAGERLDRELDPARTFGRRPVEKAGNNIDRMLDVTWR